MVDSGQVSATLRLSVGDIRLAYPMTVPAGPVPATAVVPALQGLVNAVVEAAEQRAKGMGKSVSCRKGCGACCRQLVPISRTEGERLLAVVERLPKDRRTAVETRFAEAEAALAGAALDEMLLEKDRAAVLDAIAKFDSVFGIFGPEENEILDAEIESLIEERQRARHSRNFARSDEIRDELAERGIILEDTKDGVRWKRS